MVAVCAEGLMYRAVARSFRAEHVVRHPHRSTIHSDREGIDEVDSFRWCERGETNARNTITALANGRS
jgi:hypothetical protein